MITFGFEPYTIEVVVARGSVFSTAIVTDADWPEGVQIELRFHATTAGAPMHTWRAQVDTGQATWDVPAREVDELIAGPARVAKLMFTVGDTPVLWGRGPARVAA